MIVPVLCIIMGCGLGYVGYTQYRLYTTMTNLATSPINAIAAGTVEVVGTSECNKPLTSPLSQSCAAYQYTVYKRVQRNNKTEWDLVSQQQKSTSFVLRDASGSVTVHPSKAKIIVRTQKTVRSNTLKRTEVNRNGRFRFVETIVPLNTQLYVIGNAQVEGDEYVIKAGDEFVITDKSEAGMIQQYLLSFLTSFLVGTLLIVFGIIQSLNMLDWRTFMGGL